MSLSGSFLRICWAVLRDERMRVLDDHFPYQMTSKGSEQGEVVEHQPDLFLSCLKSLTKMVFRKFPVLSLATKKNERIKPHPIDSQPF